MSNVNPTPYYAARIIIGGLTLPALPGMALTSPKGWVVPPIIGNRFQVNRGKGARMAAIDVPLVVRDRSDEVLSATFLNYFFQRTGDSFDNTFAIPGGVKFWNGAAGFNMKGAKADSFTINADYGGDVSFNCRFVGSTNGGNQDTDCLEPLTVAPPNPDFDDTPVLRFESANAGGVLADNLWQWGLSFSNNHRPDRSMHGSVFPKFMNAGMATAGFNMLVQALAPVPADDTSASLVITATGFSRTFHLPRIVDNTPDDMTIEVPESMKRHNYQCFANSGNNSNGVLYYS